MTIIGITGPAGVGKSTLANLLVDMTTKDGKHGYRASFASTLKRMVGCVLADLGHDHGMVDTQEGKAATVPELGCTVRHMLQTLGTEWGRNHVSEDMWVRIAIKNALGMVAQGYSPAIFDDIRFHNEAQAIRYNGGLVVHVRGRSDVVAGEHASERPVPIFANDVILYNRQESMDELKEDAKTILRKVEGGA